MTRESTNGRVRRSLAEWRTICERFARSGLGAEEFCLREKLTVSSFKKWYRRYLGGGNSRVFFHERAKSNTLGRATPGMPSAWT